jgi:hypothetical protein
MQYRNEVLMTGLIQTLNFNKTKLVQFMAKPSSNSVTSVSYHNNAILSSTDVTFLGILIESSYIPTPT